ncbi:hypothetical protein LXL04_005642 [Taraxacum kok-saghyz]
MHDSSSGLLEAGTAAGLEPLATSAKDRPSMGAALKCLTVGAAGAKGTLRITFRGCLAMLATSCLPLHLIFERPSSISSGFSTLVYLTNAKNTPAESLLPATYTSARLPRARTWRCPLEDWKRRRSGVMITDLVARRANMVEMVVQSANLSAERARFHVNGDRIA